jgi:hypothetical protein
MDSGAVQGLIGVDVSHSRQKMLVQKKGLDFPAPGADPADEFQGGYFQRLGAQPGEGGPSSLFFFFPENPAKPAGVHVAELLGMVPEGEGQVGVLLPWGFPGHDPQSPGHPQMDEEAPPGAQGEDDIFSPALDGADLFLPDPFAQGPPGSPKAFTQADFNS